MKTDLLDAIRETSRMPRIPGINSKQRTNVRAGEERGRPPRTEAVGSGPLGREPRDPGVPPAPGSHGEGCEWCTHTFFLKRLLKGHPGTEAGREIMEGARSGG